MIQENDTEIDYKIEESDEALFNQLLSGGGGRSYIKYDFEDPIVLARLLCPTIANGTQELHPWQNELLIFLSQHNKWTKKDYLEFFLVANNGSGKDAFIIALLTVFLSLTIIRHKTIISTSSGNQLSKQTRPYIEALANSANHIFVSLGYCDSEEKVFLIKQNHIICATTGAEIIMFVTDEPGKAEGSHPWPDCPTQELCIILNEAKSIPDDIFEAFRKCTYNRWIEISSAGLAARHFYSEFTKALDWKDYLQLPKEQRANCRKIRRRITAKDCPHISEQKIQQAIDEKGRDSYHVKTTFFSEFASYSVSIVIERSIVDACIERNVPHNRELGIGMRAGLDIGAGRAKTVITILDNNKFIKMMSLIEKDTNKTASWIYDNLTKHGVPANNCFGDDNGIGQGVLDDLRRLGYSCRRIRNQFAAIDKSTYGNLGAELYYRAEELIRKYVLNFGELVNDEDFLTQLTSRSFERRGAFDRIYLQSKDEILDAGGESPDKSDSFVLALTGLTLQDFTTNIGIQEVNTSASARMYSTSVQLNSSGTRPIPPGYTIKAGGVITLTDRFSKEAEKASKRKNIFSTMRKLYGTRN